MAVGIRSLDIAFDLSDVYAPTPAVVHRGLSLYVNARVSPRLSAVCLWRNRPTSSTPTLEDFVPRVFIAPFVVDLTLGLL